MGQLTPLSTTMAPSRTLVSQRRLLRSFLVVAPDPGSSLVAPVATIKFLDIPGEEVQIGVWGYIREIRTSLPGLRSGNRKDTTHKGDNTDEDDGWILGPSKLSTTLTTDASQVFPIRALSSGSQNKSHVYGIAAFDMDVPDFDISGS
jgi:hypothetical protein